MDTVRLDRALELLGTVDPELQLTTIRAFLFVANRGSCTQKDVELALETSNASASRNISYWTDVRFDKRPGKNFIMRVEDPIDRRFRILTLTKSGRAFYEKLRGV